MRAPLMLFQDDPWHFHQPFQRTAFFLRPILVAWQGTMWDTDMTDQGARMWGELSHDEALRIVQAPTQQPPRFGSKFA